MIITFNNPNTEKVETLTNAKILDINYDNYPKFIIYTIAHMNNRSEYGEIDLKINISYKAYVVDIKTFDKKYLLDTVNRHIINSGVYTIDIIDIHNLVITVITNKIKPEAEPTSLTGLASAILGIVTETGKKFDAKENGKSESANDTLINIARDIKKKRPPMPPPRPTKPNVDYNMIPINERITLIVRENDKGVCILPSTSITGIVISDRELTITYINDFSDEHRLYTIKYAMSNACDVYRIVAGVLSKEREYVVDLVKLEAIIHMELGV